MNTKLLLSILIVAGFTSCSTAYKAGQTPDDVYYSPVRPVNDYERTENKEDRNVYNNNSTYDDRPYDDGYIRTSSRNRRWRRYNDYDYNYPYGNQYPPVYIDPKTGVTIPATIKAPRKANLGAYKKAADNTTSPTVPGNYKLGNQVPPASDNASPVRTFQQSTKTRTGVGNFIRQVFSGSGQPTNDNYNNNNGYTSPTRTFGESNNSNNSSNTNNNTSTRSSNVNSGSTNTSNTNTNSSSAPVRTFEKKN